MNLLKNKYIKIKLKKIYIHKFYKVFVEASSKQNLV